jgi:hypothetical protein
MVEVFWGVNDLIQEKSEEWYMLIEVRPEGYIDGSGSDITLKGGICEVSSDIQRYTKSNFILLGRIKNV